MFTKVHIVILSDVFRDTMVMSTLVQTFVLPTDATAVHGVTSVLRLSHEGLMLGRHDMANVIRNIVVDPTNGAAIRLLDHSFVEEGIRVSCIDLMLPRYLLANTTPVLPMMIRTHDIFEVDEASFFSFTRHIEFSDDGYVRGLWQLNMEAGLGIETWDMRFAIDASQERCTAVCGELLPSALYEIGLRLLIGCWVDGVRGRMCYEKAKFVWGRDGRSSEVAVVIDFE